MNQMEREALEAALRSDSPPLLLEALPPRYYDDAHLPGAIRIDEERVVEQLKALGVGPDRAIVVYCANQQCRNSHRAAQNLVSGGWTRVSVYAGGKEDWREAGLPLDRRLAA